MADNNLCSFSPTSATSHMLLSSTVCGEIKDAAPSNMRKSCQQKQGLKGILKTGRLSPLSSSEDKCISKAKQPQGTTASHAQPCRRGVTFSNMSATSRWDSDGCISDKLKKPSKPVRPSSCSALSGLSLQRSMRHSHREISRTGSPLTNHVWTSNGSKKDRNSPNNEAPRMPTRRISQPEDQKMLIKCVFQTSVEDCLAQAARENQ